jgi:hypothetical protein
MAFLHGKPDDIPAGKSEKSEAAQAKLQAFREKVRGRKHCKFWTTAEELAGQVALSFAYFTKNYPAVGWVRADQRDSPETLNELNLLRKQAYELKGELQRAQRKPPVGTEDLASGDDEVTLTTIIRCHIAKLEGIDAYQTFNHLTALAWDDVLRAVGAKLFGECAEQVLQECLSNWIISNLDTGIKRDIRAWLKRGGFPPTKETRIQIRDATIDNDDFGTVIVQLVALGHITKSTRQRSVNDRRTYWTLTPYGESQVIRLRAIRA